MSRLASLPSRASRPYCRCSYQIEARGRRHVRTRIQKWGNSLALRIPKSFAAEVHLTQDSPIR
ncbi:MAG: AbrB/MazE/SpoVT family DNA-binding domain-containing protein [Chloroflexota bacterium]